MSGLAVIDCDRHGEADGVNNFRELCAANGLNTDNLPLAATPNDGCHVYFRQPAGEPIGCSRGELPDAVEVKGKGGCITAPGTILPDGREYLIEGNWSAIPVLPDFIKNRLLAGRAVSAQITGSSAEPSYYPPSETSFDEIRELLYWIDPDCGYEDWVKALMALHAATGGSGAGLALANDWSARGKKYQGAKDIEIKWRSFRSGGGVNKSTLAALAHSYGANLSEIARRYMPQHTQPQAAQYQQINDNLKNSNEAKRTATMADGTPYDTRTGEIISRPPAPAKEPKELSLANPFNIADANIPPRDWLIKGFLLRRLITVLAAPGGTGKSILAIHLALMLASGKTWGGFSVPGRKKVLILNAEDDYDEMQRRIYAAQHDMSLPPDDLKDYFFTISKQETADICIAAQKENMIVPTALPARLKKTLIQNQIDVIIVDPFIETFMGNENDNNIVAQVMKKWRDDIAKDCNCGILLITHTRKGAKESPGDQDITRGAGALVASARNMFTLLSMTKNDAEEFGIADDERHKFVRLDDAKQNLSERSDGKGRWFRKHSYSLNNGTENQAGDSVGVLRPVYLKKQDGLPDADTCKEILKEVDEAWKEGKPFTYAPQAKASGRYAFSYFADKYNRKEYALRDLFERWARNNIIDFVVYDTRSGAKGYRKIGDINIRESYETMK